MLRKSHVSMIILSVCLFCAALLLPPHAAFSAERVRIGGTLGITGKYASFSDMQRKGFRLWEEDVNRRGGMLGRPVEVIILDDESNPEKAVQLYHQLIEEYKVDLLLAPFSSQITWHILPVAEQSGFPILVSGASADRLWEQGYSNIYGMFLPASRLAHGFLEMLVMNGRNNVAIVYARDPFSSDISSGTVKWAEMLKMNVVLYESIGGKTPDEVQNIAREIVSLDVDALIVCGFMDEFITIRNAMEQVGGYHGTYYTPVGPGLPEFYEQLGDKAEYIFSTSQWELHLDKNMHGSREFYSLFAKRFQKDPSYFAATAYASGQILEQAVQQAGSLDRDLIQKALSEMNASSIIGRYGVDSNGIQIRKFNLTIQVQKGATEVVWPESLISKPPVFPDETAIQKYK